MWRWLGVMVVACTSSSTVPDPTTDDPDPTTDDPTTDSETDSSTEHFSTPPCEAELVPVELDVPLDAGFTTQEVLDLLGPRVWDAFFRGASGHPVSLSVTAANPVWQASGPGECPAPHLQLDVTVAFEQATAGFAGSADGLAWAFAPGSVQILVRTRDDDLALGFDPEWVFGEVSAEEVGVDLALVFAAEPRDEQMCGLLTYHTPGLDTEVQVASAPRDLCESMPAGYFDLSEAVGPAP